VLKAHGHCDCCEVMYVCVEMCVLVHKAHGHCDCCEGMHVCACLCLGFFKAHTWSQCLLRGHAYLYAHV
jgi:hypothetical protein